MEKETGLDHTQSMSHTDSMDHPPSIEHPPINHQPGYTTEKAPQGVNGETEDAQLFNSVRFGMRSNVIRLLSKSRDLVKVMGK